jgi:hypothetical protein
MLGVDQLRVDRDIEDAATFRNEGRLNRKCLFDLRSQTDRFGLVVSLCAIGDLDVH